MSGLSLRDRVRSSDIQEELRAEPLLLRVKRSQFAWGGVLGISIREETPGQTQNTLERLYLSADLGILWYTPEGAGVSSWGEECLGFPAETAAPATRTRISGRRQDEMRGDERQMQQKDYISVGDDTSSIHGLTHTRGSSKTIKQYNSLIMNKCTHKDSQVFWDLYVNDSLHKNIFQCAQKYFLF